MNELLTAITTGLTAFTATNLDDIVILLLFFSQVNTVFRRRHIVAGQYLGFAALVAVSLPGFFSGLLLPRPWIGMLGIVPIAIGISRLLQTECEADREADHEATGAETAPEATASKWLTMLSPQAYSVAAVTFANGGDNIGIYMPLFANSPWESLVVILSVFFALVGVWCGAAYQLMKVPAIAEMLTRYGNQLVPFVLIGLGVLILIDSHTLENRGLAVLTLLISGIFTLNLLRKLEQVPVAKLYSTSHVASEMEKS